MPGLVNLQVVGDATGVQALLLRLQEALGPAGMTRFMHSRAEPIIRQRAIERFQSEGDDVSGKWLPLTRYTQNIRASQGYPPAHPINVRTRELERWVTQSPSQVTGSATATTMQYPAGEPSGDLWEKLQTAQVGIQGGGSRPGVPARPVLGVNEKDLEMILLGLAAHIQVGTP